MKVRDLLKMEVDIDVYDDVSDGIGVCFCGPAKLTEKGEEEFNRALELEVTLRNYSGDVVAIVMADPADPWDHALKNANDLFWALAGYCPEEDYDEWFEENE